jgi:DNA-binding transcriptional LysR family regulator
VGAPLFTRTTRSVGLTEAGQVFLEQASAGVAYVEAAYEAAQRLSNNPRGLLRLSVPYVAQTLFEPMLKGFTDAYPDIELELVFEDRFVDVAGEGYDAGIRIGEMIAQDMVAVRLTPASPRVVVGSPAYFAERGKPLRPEELERHSCINIRLAGGAVYRWDFVEHTEEIGTRSFVMDVAGGLTVNGPATSLSAAQAGVGLAYNIAGVVEPLIRQGLLETCLETFMPTSPGFFIYFSGPKTSATQIAGVCGLLAQLSSLSSQLAQCSDCRAKGEIGVRRNLINVLGQQRLLFTITGKWSNGAAHRLSPRKAVREQCCEDGRCTNSGSGKALLRRQFGLEDFCRLLRRTLRIDRTERHRSLFRSSSEKLSDYARELSREPNSDLAACGQHRKQTLYFFNESRTKDFVLNRGLAGHLPSPSVDQAPNWSTDISPRAIRSMTAFTSSVTS